LRRCEVALRWQELVGPRVAARTNPRGLKNCVLTVEVSSSAWLNELSFLREQLRLQIDRGLGGNEVNELRLVLRSGVGHSSPPSAVDPPRPTPSAAEQTVAEERADKDVPRLDDDELRQKITRARKAQLLRH